MWNISNLQKPRWQPLSSGSGCRGHSRIVFSLCAGGKQFTTLVSVSMDRQVRLKSFSSVVLLHLIFTHVIFVHYDPVLYQNDNTGFEQISNVSFHFQLASLL